MKLAITFSAVFIIWALGTAALLNGITETAKYHSAGMNPIGNSISPR